MLLEVGKEDTLVELQNQKKHDRVQGSTRQYSGPTVQVPANASVLLSLVLFREIYGIEAIPENGRKTSVCRERTNSGYDVRKQRGRCNAGYFVSL